MGFAGKLLDGKTPEHQDCVVSVSGGTLSAKLPHSTTFEWDRHHLQQYKILGGKIRITLTGLTDDHNDPVLLLEETDEIHEELVDFIGKKSKPLHIGAWLPMILGGIVLTGVLILLFVNNLWRVLPHEVDIHLGQSAYPAFLQQFGGTVIKDPDLQAFLDHSVEQLKDPQSPYPYHITIFENSISNAFALPGGHICISSGLIDESETAEEIIGILAHEMAHVEKRHGMQNISRSAGIFFVISTTFGIVGGLEEFEMAEALLDLMAILPMMHYSRNMEAEADEIALQKLSQEMISAQGMHDFFKRMSESDIGHIEEKIPDWLSTHPASKKRMALMQEHVNSEPNYQPLMSAEAWKKLKARE